MRSPDGNPRRTQARQLTPRVPKSRPQPPSVEGQSGAKQHCARRRSTPVRRRDRQNDPQTDTKRRQTVVGCQLGRQASVPLDLGQQRQRVGELGPELETASARCTGCQARRSMAPRAPRSRGKPPARPPSRGPEERRGDARQCSLMPGNNRSRSPHLQRGTRSTRSSTAAESLRRVSTRSSPAWPRSTRDTVLSEQPIRSARSVWRHPRRIRIALSAAPRRWSSIRRSVVGWTHRWLVGLPGAPDTAPPQLPPAAGATAPEPPPAPGATAPAPRLVLRSCPTRTW